jgi:hypothetical protein
VSLDLTLFLDFLKLFVKMRLAVSFSGLQKSYFLDLRIKSYGCLKFLGEVLAWHLCVGSNEEELTTCAKFWGQEVGGRGYEGAIMGDPRKHSWRPTGCRL